MSDMGMNQLWATQQAKLEEKDAEIERLNEIISTKVRMLDIQLSQDQLEHKRQIREKDAEIKRLRKIIRQAIHYTDWINELDKWDKNLTVEELKNILSALNNAK